MQAIETEWKGYRFRSRLEARYAVLFSEMGLDWDYELQGFKLHDGRQYLPDFYLRDFNLFVEIKGGSASDRAKSKLRDFDSPIILFENLPTFSSPLDGLDGTLFTHDVCDSGGGVYPACEAHIMRCIKCGKWVVDVRANDSRLGDDRHLVDPQNGHQKWGPFCEHGYHAMFRVAGSLEDATESAKSARFEHGESPSI